MKARSKDEELRAFRQHACDDGQASDNQARPASQRACEIEGTMAFAQRSAIEAALRRSAGNLTLTAGQLRIGRTTLYRLMKAYDIHPVRSDDHERRPVNGAPETPRVIFVNDSWYLTNKGRRRAD